MSTAIGRWQQGGRRVNASRSAACNLAASKSCTAVPACSSRTVSTSRTWPDCRLALAGTQTCGPRHR